MTKKITDEMLVSITAPSAPQWLNAMDSNKRFYHVGHCNRAFQASLRSIVCSWVQYKDDKSFPITPDLRRCGYMCDSYAMDKGIEVPTQLPSSYIEAIAKWRELAPETGVSKSILPAYIPSVAFNHDFIVKWREANTDNKSKYLSAKALAGKDPRAWNHTGLFCIDIDLGHDGNPGTPDALYEQAQSILPLRMLPGFLFSFASPNQGIKIFLRVSPELKHLLNTPSGCEDIDLNAKDISQESLSRLQSSREQIHAACFYALAKVVSQHAGLAVDLTCSDPCRLQFMFRAFTARLEINPDLLNPNMLDSDIPGFSFAGETEFEDAKHYAAKKGVGNNSLLPKNYEAGSDIKPAFILAFCDWLESRGWTKEAQHVRSMVPGDQGYYSHCSQCMGVSSTPSNPRDLLLWLDKDQPGRFGFKCFHVSCSNRSKVKHPFWYLAKLYREEQESLKLAEEYSMGYTISESLRKFIYTQSTLRPNQTITNSMWTASANIIEPEAKPNYFQFDEKSGMLLCTPDNIMNFVRHCMGLYSIYNKDLCCIEFINPETGSKYSFEAVRKKVQGVFRRKTHKDSSKIFLDIFNEQAQDNPYSPLFTMGYWEEWDGIPRVDKYIDLLEWDPNHEPPKVMKEDGTPMTGQEWKRHALRSWLVNCWERVVCGVYDCTHVPTFGGRPTHPRPENKMIIFCSETQGVGKTQWIKNLVAPLANEALVLEGKLEENKDHDKLSALKPIFYIDEMEKTTRDERMNAHLKMVLTRDYIDVRDPYDREITHRAVITSFIGATNEPKPLSDADGSRRLVLLYVRRPKDKMNNVNNCPEHVKEMHELNVPQFWAEIRYMSETAKPGQYTLTPYEKELVQYNKTTGLENGEFTHLSNYLRYIDVNFKDFEGKPLRKHIDPSFNDTANIINWVRKYLGEKEIKVTPRNNKQFRQHLLALPPNGCSPTYRAGASGTNRVKRFAFLCEDEFERLASIEARRAWAEAFPEEAANYYKRKKFAPTEGDLDVMDPEWQSKLELYRPYYEQYLAEGDED